MRSSLALGLSVALLASSQLAATCGPGGMSNGPPEPDDCGSPNSAAAIATLEIGPAGSDDFVPWSDGGAVSIAYGPQGGAMIPLRLRATGTDLADCMIQTTHITGAPTLSELGSNETPLRWYDDPAGGRATHTHYIILDREPSFHEPVHVETTVLGVTVARDLVVMDQ